MRRCDHCKEEFEPRKQGRRQRFCPGGECRKANERERWRAGTRALNRRTRPNFEDERRKPEFQKGVAEILAWAEAQHPATPEAWRVTVGREMKAACAMETDNEAQALNT